MWYCSRIFPAYFCARVIMIFSKLFVWVQPTYKKNASHDVLLEDFHKTNPSVYPHPRPTQNSAQHLSSLFSNRPPEVLTSKTCFFADTFTWNHKIASFFFCLVSVSIQVHCHEIQSCYHTYKEFTHPPWIYQRSSAHPNLWMSVLFPALDLYGSCFLRARVWGTPVF